MGRATKNMHLLLLLLLQRWLPKKLEMMMMIQNQMVRIRTWLPLTEQQFLWLYLLHAVSCLWFVHQCFWELWIINIKPIWISSYSVSMCVYIIYIYIYRSAVDLRWPSQRMHSAWEPDGCVRRNLRGNCWWMMRSTTNIKMVVWKGNSWRWRSWNRWRNMG